MKTTVSKYDFERAFVDHNRKDTFSYEGLNLLFDYLEEYEESCGVEVELDVVALCCEYDENHWQDIADSYNIDLDDVEEDEKKNTVREYLEENTQLVGETDKGFIYACF